MSCHIAYEHTFTFGDYNLIIVQERRYITNGFPWIFLTYLHHLFLMCQLNHSIPQRYVLIESMGPQRYVPIKSWWLTSHELVYLVIRLCFYGHKDNRHLFYYQYNASSWSQWDLGIVGKRMEMLIFIFMNALRINIILSVVVNEQLESGFLMLLASMGYDKTMSYWANEKELDSPIVRWGFLWCA